jgi:hypothetical protein
MIGRYGGLRGALGRERSAARGRLLAFPRDD